MSKNKIYRIGILASHPIQYYSPLYKVLSNHPKINLTVYYCHQQSKSDQAVGGFGVEFDWDINLLEGFSYKFLNNISKKPNTYSFFGCDTPEISNIIKEEKFDAFIIQGWYLKSFIQTIYACNKYNTLVFVRGDSQLKNNPFILKILKIPIYKFLLSRFNAFLAVGKRSSDYFKYYGANEKKIFFTPHCVDNDYFKRNVVNNIYKINILKRNYNIPINSIVFLFVGKLILKKRPFDFVKSIELAQKRNPDIHGLIVGDGQLKKEILNYINYKNLNITYAGFLNQSKIPEAYSISDMIILPSGQETWGLVINEAFASGLPALVCKDAGCSEDLIKENITGNVFANGDVEYLSELILKYSYNKELLKQMKINSIKHIDRYSIEVTNDNIVNAIITTNKQNVNYKI